MPLRAPPRAPAGRRRRSDPRRVEAEPSDLAREDRRSGRVRRRGRARCRSRRRPRGGTARVDAAARTKNAAACRGRDALAVHRRLEVPGVPVVIQSGAREALASPCASSRSKRIVPSARACGPRGAGVLRIACTRCARFADCGRGLVCFFVGASSRRRDARAGCFGAEPRRPRDDHERGDDRDPRAPRSATPPGRAGRARWAVRRHAARLRLAPRRSAS